MYGAIIGDICGSYYENRRHSTKSMDAPLIVNGSRFTDDTVLTVAVAEAILRGGRYKDFIRSWYRKYPNAGFGRGFREWMEGNGAKDNDSFGNGAAMRVSPVAWAFDDPETILSAAAKSAKCSHSHPEGVKGAQAVAMAIYSARTGLGKKKIAGWIQDTFGYNMNRTIDDIRPGYKFSSWAQNSVPEAILCALRTDSFEEAIRAAISLGGDADTQASIAGAIAEALYGRPEKRFTDIAARFLPAEMMNIVTAFEKKYMANYKPVS